MAVRVEPLDAVIANAGGSPMNGRTTADRPAPHLILGIALLLVGGAALVLRQLDLDVSTAIVEAGWPFFVIVPGVVLFASSFLLPVPKGVGLAIGGAVVTTVGTVLLYQETTGHWESWSYAWALVGPAAAGIGMVLYGLLTRTQELVTTGVRLVLIGAGLFVVGYWYFEAIFANGEPPLDVWAWWPIVMVGVGLAVVAAALLRGRPAPAEPKDVDPGAA
jgi:hypothetical protein